MFSSQAAAAGGVGDFQGRQILLQTLSGQIGLHLNQSCHLLHQNRAPSRQGLNVTPRTSLLVLKTTVL